jgi:hypothetical protein
MTERQILEALPDNAARLTGPAPPRTIDGVLANVGIPELRIGRTLYKVYFLVDPQKGLTSVHFTPAAGSDVTELEFAAIESLLAEKYGHPLSRKSAEDPQVQSSQWSFPTTTITIRLTTFRRIGLRTLWLSYERRTELGDNPL